MSRYELWAIARFFRRALAILVVGPVFLLFSPFAFVGELAIRAFHGLYDAR